MRISPKKRPQTVAEFLSILDDRKASKDSNVTNKVVEENTIFGPLGSSNTPKPSSGSSHNFGQAFPGSAPKEKSQSKNPSISNTDLFKDFIPAGPMPFKSDVLEESSDRDEIVDNPILGKEVPFKDSKDSKDKDSKVTSGAFISNPFVPSSANKKSEEVQFPSSPIPSRSDLINESPSSKDAFQDKNQNPFKPEAQKFDTSSATKTSGQEPLPFNTQSSVPSNKTAHQPKTVAPNEVKVEAPSQPFGFPSFVPSDKKDSQQVSGASKVPNQPKVETPLTTNNTPSTPSSTSIPSTTSTPSTTPNLSNEHPLPSNQSADSASKTTSTFKSPFGDNPQPAQPVVDEYDYDDEEKSSKSKIYIGIAVAAIIALVCWFAFGGKKSETSNPNEEGDQLALVEDSIENTIEQVVVNGPALTVVPPTNVKVGEEFKVIFRLSEGKGKDFKAKDINGLEKISGPEEVKTKKGVDYTFTYKAEKEGIYSIPIATIKVDGKSLSSKSRKFSVKAGQGTNIVEEQFAPVEKEQVLAVTTGNINGHEWVDLGLPSGTKWATTNIGATQPEQYGGYYTWGETKSKSTFDQDNCETFGKDDAWLKENGFIGGSGNLSLSHDPARQTWGGTWRLPTLNEIKELKSNTTTEWITSNGVHGCLVKSKKNDNSIFLPAAGWRLGPTLYNGGTIGYYLTSTPYSSEPYGVYYIEFDWNTFMATWGGRHSGRSVRPVSD